LGFCSGFHVGPLRRGGQWCVFGGILSVGGGFGLGATAWVVSIGRPVDLDQGLGARCLLIV
jgi:hypothetical protein